ncbi:MAG: hypothetical protein MO853_05545 [Candidatus Protistobacter heckmanni]|nr:hypothetical protein [Candidatus Protistobacter heckmanni]
MTIQGFVAGPAAQAAVGMMRTFGSAVAKNISPEVISGAKNLVASTVVSTVAGALANGGRLMLNHIEIRKAQDEMSRLPSLYGESFGGNGLQPAKGKSPGVLSQTFKRLSLELLANFLKALGVDAGWESALLGLSGHCYRIRIVARAEETCVALGCVELMELRPEWDGQQILLAMYLNYTLGGAVTAPAWFGIDPESQRLCLMFVTPASQLHADGLVEVVRSVTVILEDAGLRKALRRELNPA